MSHFAKPWHRKGRGWFLELHGKQINLGNDQEEAFARYHQIMAGQAPTGTQVSGILDAYLDWCKLHRDPKTYLWYKIRCKSFWESMKSRDLSMLDAADLKPLHLEEWLQEHPTWNPGMRRTALRAIQRSYNWAVKQGRLDRSPIAHMEKPPQGQRDNVILPEMYDTILGKVKGPFRDLLVVAWEVGCRPQEILRVEARHFDGEKWVFPKKESKGKKRIRIVYLTEAAVEIVRRRAKDFPSGPIFRNRSGKPWTPYSVNCRFCRLQLKIGRKFALVDFRHSFVTRLLKAGIDPITISTLCGHADLSMIAKVYAHLQQDAGHLQKALAKGALTSVSA